MSLELRILLYILKQSLYILERRFKHATLKYLNHRPYDLLIRVPIIWMEEYAYAGSQII
jgi:hypothetical protein